MPVTQLVCARGQTRRVRRTRSASEAPALSSMRRSLAPLLVALSLAAADQTSLDCPLRQIGLDYAASLQPFRPAAAFDEIADALNGAIEAANCSVKPKALQAGKFSASASRVAWAPLPAGSGVGSIFADPTKGSDSAGDGTVSKPFRTIQRALKAVSSARARLQLRPDRAPFAIVLRAGTFHLGSTINLDSSTGSFVSFQAYPSEQVSISGAAPIQHVKWVPFSPPPRASYETKLGCLAIQFDAAPAGKYSAVQATSMCDQMATCAAFVINAGTGIVNFKTEVFWAPTSSKPSRGEGCAAADAGMVYIKYRRPANPMRPLCQIQTRRYPSLDVTHRWTALLSPH